VNAWDELVADAVLGTERRPPVPPETAGPVRELLAAIAWTDAESALLAAAATVSVYREAGRRPVRDPEPPPPAAAPETRQRCGPAAGARLAAMLAGEHRALLPEWLGAVDERGLRVPEEHLPALLELARWQRDFRERVVAVAGERGRWLAIVNPDWAYAAAGGQHPEREWTTAPRDARPLLLARMRRDDPAAARELLERSWSTESPADRPKLVEALAQGLAMADEPFLEVALDDRRKEVRRAAADLLVKLPESRLAGRMADLLRPLVRTEGAIRRRLVVDLPESVDESLLRDGVVAKPPAGEGARAWWLRQLVGAAPLSFWAVVGAPADVVRLGARSEVATALLAGWASAAVAQRDGVWADTLLALHGDPALVSVLDPARREEVATAVVGDRRARVTDAFDVLAACGTPWGLPLSRAVVALVTRLLADTGSAPDSYRLRDAIPRLAAGVDPAVADEAADALTDIGRTGWSARVAAAFVEMISFRREMLEELG
jgi:hypothetical protein